MYVVSRPAHYFSIADTRRKSYFLLSVSPDIPVLYHVDRVRDGSSYATRFVRAAQDGKAVYIMMCSFQLPEHLQPSRHWPMPKVAPPEDCVDDVELIRRSVVDQPDRTEEVKAWILGFAQVIIFCLVVLAKPFAIHLFSSFIRPGTRKEPDCHQACGRNC